MPLHPGEILKAELRSRGIKQKDFAEQIGMRPSHLSALLHGVRNVSPQVAARIEDVLHIPAQSILNLQVNYNLDVLRTSELVDGYANTSLPAYALAEPNAQESALWDRAYRAGQNEAVRKIKQTMVSLGFPEEIIEKATAL